MRADSTNSSDSLPWIGGHQRFRRLRRVSVAVLSVALCTVLVVVVIQVFSSPRVTPWGVGIPMVDGSVADYGQVACFGRDSCLVTDGFTYSQIVESHSVVPVHGRVPYEATLVTCMGGPTCITFATGVDVATLRGDSWVLSPPIPFGNASSPPDWIDVSCYSRTMCMAVGTMSLYGVSPSAVAVWNGKVWRLLPDPPSVVFGGVSCPAPRVCFASASPNYNLNLSVVLEWTRGQWHTIGQMTSPSELLGISCSSVTFCVSAGASAQVVIWNGRSVHVVGDGVKVGSGNDGGGMSVDCWKNFNCVVVNWKGDVLEIGKTGVVDSQYLDATLDDAECTSSGFCVAVGGDGLAYRHQL